VEPEFALKKRNQRKSAIRKIDLKRAVRFREELDAMAKGQATTASSVAGTLASGNYSPLYAINFFGTAGKAQRHFWPNSRVHK
jgi:hypothetical protein